MSTSLILGILGVIIFGGLLFLLKSNGKKIKVPVIGLIVSLLVFGSAISNTDKSSDEIEVKASLSSSVTTIVPESAGQEAPSITPSNVTADKPLFASTLPSNSVSGVLVVSFLDVGQADSQFIELPNGQTILIDAGNSDDGSNIVKYINDKGYSKIDFLVATHPHADHIGGMAKAIDSFDISSIYMPKVTNNTQTFEDLLNTIKGKGLSINTAKAGVLLIDAPDLQVSMLAPYSSKYDDLNNYSAVVKIVYRNNSFLFMGDAQTQSENEITADMNADVLKVGHHGSDTSTGEAFLKKVSPQYAIISVGAGNDYGHPDDTTLQKLANIGAEIYSTDKNGTIVFTSDGVNISADKSPSETYIVAQDVVSAQPSPSNNDSVSNSNSPIVYVTETGSKYHNNGCQYLSHSQISMSLKDAVAAGYSPCSKCGPPVINTASSNSSNSASSSSVQQSNDTSVTVYVTNSGEKYHTGSCRYLKNSKISISLSSAQAQGYGPCSVCDPPT